MPLIETRRNPRARRVSLARPRARRPRRHPARHYDGHHRNDLSFHHPEIVARLRPLIDAWEKEVEADATVMLGPLPAPATATSQ